MVLPACYVWALFLYSALGCQKALDPLGLELEMVINYHVDAGN